MNKFLTFYSNQDNKEHDIDEMKKSSFAEEHKDHLQKGKTCILS